MNPHQLQCPGRIFPNCQAENSQNLKIPRVTERNLGDASYCSTVRNGLQIEPAHVYATKLKHATSRSCVPRCHMCGTLPDTASARPEPGIIPWRLGCPFRISLGLVILCLDNGIDHRFRVPCGRWFYGRQSPKVAIPGMWAEVGR
jgi:hypothetical protein